MRRSQPPHPRPHPRPAPRGQRPASASPTTSRLRGYRLFLTPLPPRGSGVASGLPSWAPGSSTPAHTSVPTRDWKWFTPRSERGDLQTLPPRPPGLVPAVPGRASGSLCDGQGACASVCLCVGVCARAGRGEPGGRLTPDTCSQRKNAVLVPERSM